MNNKNVKWIYLAAAGVAVVSTVVFFYERYSEGVQDKARNALYEARKLFPTQPEAEGKVDPDQAFSKAIPQLSEIAKNSPSKSVKFEAAFELGSLFVANAKSERALEFLAEAEKVADSDFKKASVSWLKAHALEQQKNWTETEKEYVKITKTKQMGLKAQALIALIALSQVQGKADTAKSYLEALKRDFSTDQALVAKGEQALEQQGASL
jgi:tetratricopeptide (TPR) repeat protein